MTAMHAQTVLIHRLSAGNDSGLSDAASADSLLLEAPLTAVTANV